MPQDLVNLPLRHRRVRTVAVASLAVALLAAGSPLSAAAAALPSPRAAAAITLKATPAEVRAGEKVSFSGRTKGIPIGGKLVLQRRHGDKWMTLQASTTVKQGSSYSLDAKFTTTGKEELRVKYDEVTSPTVTVAVR